MNLSFDLHLILRNSFQDPSVIDVVQCITSRNGDKTFTLLHSFSAVDFPAYLDALGIRNRVEF